MPRARKPKVGPDKTVLYMIVKPGSMLAPASDFDAERIARFRTGTRLRLVEPHPEKDWAKDRLYRAVVGRVAKAKGVDPDVLHDQIKLATGRVVGVDIWRSGDVHHRSYRAISVADMGAAEFDSFFNDAVEQIDMMTGGMDFETLLDMAAEDLREHMREWSPER